MIIVPSLVLLILLTLHCLDRALKHEKRTKSLINAKKIENNCHISTWQKYFPKRCLQPSYSLSRTRAIENHKNNPHSLHRCSKIASKLSFNDLLNRLTQRKILHKWPFSWSFIHNKGVYLIRWTCAWYTIYINVQNKYEAHSKKKPKKKAKLLRS